MDSYRIPKPEWKIHFDEERGTMRAVPSFVEDATKELTRRVWEIEESVLTTSVVDLLRSKGYTVIEPDDKTTH